MRVLCDVLWGERMQWLGPRARSALDPYNAAAECAVKPTFGPLARYGLDRAPPLQRNL